MRLDVKAFSLASGITSGISTLVIGLFTLITGQGLQFFEILAPFHPGYAPTFGGMVINAIWMLIYGLIIGALLAFVYNYLAKE